MTKMQLLPNEKPQWPTRTYLWIFHYHPRFLKELKKHAECRPVADTVEHETINMENCKKSLKGQPDQGASKKQTQILWWAMETSTTIKKSNNPAKKMEAQERHASSLMEPPRIRHRHWHKRVSLEDKKEPQQNWLTYLRTGPSEISKHKRRKSNMGNNKVCISFWWPEDSMSPNSSLTKREQCYKLPYPSLQRL